MKKILLTCGLMALLVGAFAATKDTLFPSASDPGTEFDKVSSSNFKFQETSLTNDDLISTLFPDGAPTTTAAASLGLGWVSNNSEFIDNHNGFITFAGPYTFANNDVIDDNVENLKKGFSILDLGKDIGKVLVINGYESNFADYLYNNYKENFGLSQKPNIPPMESSVNDLTQMCFVPKQTFKDKNGGTVRVRVELNVFNLKPSTNNFASILRVNGANNFNPYLVEDDGTVKKGTAPAVSATRIVSDQFRCYSNDFKNSNDRGDMIAGTWNPYRWMVYEFDCPLETGQYASNIPTYLKFQIPAGTLDGSAILIRNVEFLYAKTSDISDPIDNTIRYTWLDFTPEEIIENVPTTKADIFPVAKELSSAYINVTPSYYKFYEQKDGSFLKEMLRDDIFPETAQNLGPNDKITANTNGGENWFTTEGLSKGNLLLRGGEYHDSFEKTPQSELRLLDAFSLFDFGGELKKVLVINGKDSKLNEAIQKFAEHENAYNIQKMNFPFQNMQLMWILDHLTMKAKNINANYNVHVRMEINVYNNNIDAEREIFSEIFLQNEKANFTQIKTTKVAYINDFAKRKGDDGGLLDDGSYDDNSASEWYPKRWMVLDFEAPYTNIGTFLRTAILKDDVRKPLDNGALLIRSIEIYGIPKASSTMKDGEVNISWKEYDIQVEEPTFAQYKEDPTSNSIKDANPAGDKIEEENFAKFQEETSLKNVWSLKNAEITKNYYYSPEKGKNLTLDDEAISLDVNTNTITIKTPEDLGEELHYGIVRIKTDLDVDEKNTYNFLCEAGQKARSADAPEILINVTSNGEGAKAALANKTANGVTHYASNMTLPTGKLVIEVHFGGNAGKDIILSNLTFALKKEGDTTDSKDPENPDDPGELEPDDEDFMAGEAVNRAIRFAEEGTVNCGAMPELNNLESYSIQFFVKPTVWKEGASLMHRGDSFSVELGANNTVVFKNGDNKVTATGFQPEEWNQVTLIVNNGVASLLVNNKDGGKGTLGKLEETKRAFIMGGGYTGLLDEVRLWDAALNDMMKRFDYFTNNTLNKWNPMWENLVAYYKMDQEVCPVLVDYKVLENKKADGTNNHGVFSQEGVTRVVANNDKLPYLINAAYTENARFYDRLIPKDAYLLSNEIIILGADCVAADGSIALRTPNNHGVVNGNVQYVESFGSRTGVAYFDGQAGSYIEAPAATIHKYKSGTEVENSDLNYYELMTRLYIDKWQPGANLLRKENDAHTSGLAIYLGETPNTLVIRVDGKTNTSEEITNFKLGAWNQISIYTNSSSRSAASKYYLYVNGVACEFDSAASAIETTSLSAVKDIPVRVGEGLNGYMDETYLSNADLGSVRGTYINKGVIVPTVDQGRNLAEMAGSGFLFLYDNEEYLGYSSFSQDYIADYIRSLYKGYTAPKIVLSVRGFGTADNPGNDSEFNLIMNNATKRKVFAEQLAELSEHYDGVELDFEWVYDATGWKNYHQLSEAIIEALPEDKSFRISTHNVTYAYPKDGINNEGIDGFTFQMYGPNYKQDHMSYSNFEEMIQKFIDYGYPKEKIMSSFSTTTTKTEKEDPVNGNITGVRMPGFYDSYVLPAIGEEKDVDIANGRKYMSPMQVYKRAKYTREQELSGIFYWDMGNDYWLGSKNMQSGGVAYYEGMPEFNAAKYCSFGINSNIDRAVKSAKVTHPDTEVVPGEEVEIPDLDDDFVQDENPEEGGNNGGTSLVDSLDSEEYVDVYSITGSLVKKNINVSELPYSLQKGIYIINGKKVLVK